MIVYGLIDPHNNEIRYIGVTGRSMRTGFVSIPLSNATP